MLKATTAILGAPIAALIFSRFETGNYDAAFAIFRAMGRVLWVCTAIAGAICGGIALLVLAAVFFEMSLWLGGWWCAPSIALMFLLRTRWFFPRIPLELQICTTIVCVACWCASAQHASRYDMTPRPEFTCALLEYFGLCERSVCMFYFF